MPGTVLHRRYYSELLNGAYAGSTSDAVDTFTISTGDTLTRVSGSFVTDGWVVGKKFEISASGLSFTGTVLTVSALVITFSVQSGSAVNAVYTDAILFQSNYTSNLVGNPMEQVYCESILEYRVFSDADIDSDTYVITGEDTITRGIGFWEDDEWQVGDSFRFVDGATDFIGLITGIVDDVLTFSRTSGTTPNNGSYTAAVMNISNGMLAAVYSYGLIENSEGTNYLDKVSGTLQAHELTSITGIYQVMNVTGNDSWKTGDTYIKRISFADGVATYMIRQHFISPYCKAEWEDYLTTGQPTEYDGKSFKHVWKLQLRQAISNPNNEKVYEDNLILGAHKWIGLPYNGAAPVYTLALTSYTDESSGASVTGVQVNLKTKITGTITATAGVFDASTPVNALVSAILTPAEYAANTTLFKELWLWDNAVALAGVEVTGLSGIIKRIETVITSTSVLTFEIEVEFTTAQIAFLAARYPGVEFMVTFQTANHALTQANSDKMVCRPLVSTMVHNTDIDGLADWGEPEYFKQDQDPDDSGTVGYTNIDGGIEQNFMAKVQLAVTIPARIVGLRTKVISHNNITGNNFTLDQYNCDLSSETRVPIGTGDDKQVYQLDTRRGYKLPIGDPFDRVRFYETIDASPLRWKEDTLTTGGLNTLVFFKSYNTNDYNIVFTDVDGVGFSYKDINKYSTGFRISKLSDDQGKLRHLAVQKIAITGIRSGVATLVNGANTVSFDSFQGGTLGTTSYALLINDLDGGGIESIVKGNSGFDITALSPEGTRISYVVVVLAGMASSPESIRATSQTIVEGANTVTFQLSGVNVPMDSDDYTLNWKTLEHYGQIYNLAYTADGYTFDAVVAGGTIESVAILNRS